MAKRKRLEMPMIEPDLQGSDAAPAPRARMPIAEVAGDTAGRAALEEVAREMTAAETEGRVVKKLPLGAIDIHHLTRDRLVLDEAEMEALTASIRSRGQQTPVEVLPLGAGRYGLISGLRRVEALKTLGKGHVLALVRRPEGARDAYQAMVEENEIRAGLSFFERAEIARSAVEQGVYGDVRAAVAGLFAHAPAAKRSKITKFVTICEALGDALAYPAALPEHFGLALAGALEADRRLAGRIGTALARTPPEDAQAERQLLERALKTPATPKAKAEALAPGLTLEARTGRVVLSGKAVDGAFLEALRAFALSHAKPKA